MSVYCEGYLENGFGGGWGVGQLNVFFSVYKATDYFLDIWVVNHGVNVWFGLLGVLYKSLLKLFKLIGFGLGEETKI